MTNGPKPTARLDPFCNEEMALFASAAPAVEKEDIKVVAFSVDDEAATKNLSPRTASRSRSATPRPLRRSSPRPAYVTEAPARGRFLETTGFVIAPDGTVVNAVYSSRAIGRLVPSDIVRLISFIKSLSKTS